MTPHLTKLLFTMALALLLTSCEQSPSESTGQSNPSAQATINTPTEDTASPTDALPRLVDLGASSCVPCRMMAPILDALREEYEGIASVEFIDVSENPGQADAHGIQVIPTQIFFNASGEEVFRHSGFMPREAIIAQFESMGIAAPPDQDQ